MTRPPRLALFVADLVTGSSRLRALQYVPMLRRDGVQVRICTTRPSTYLPRPDLLPAGSIAHRIYQVVGFLLVVAQRLWQILTVVPRVDAVLVQKRLLFRSRSGALEFLLLWVARRHGVRVVFDVDDAIHLGTSAGRRSGLRRAVMSVASRADVVVAGSDALARDFAPHARSVRVVPTCSAPLGRTSHPARADASRALRLVWTGSPGNAVHLLLVREALTELARTVDVRLEIVTRLEDMPDIYVPGLETVLTPYSPRAEAVALHRADVGLAPLASTPWTRAKCGGRILAYFSAGLPVVASPVGAQATMVQDHVTGLQASTWGDWTEALRSLDADPHLRQRLGEAGLRRLGREFDPVRAYPRWRELVIGS